MDRWGQIRESNELRITNLWQCHGIQHTHNYSTIFFSIDNQRCLLQHYAWLMELLNNAPPLTHNQDVYLMKCSTSHCDRSQNSKCHLQTQTCSIRCPAACSCELIKSVKLNFGPNPFPSVTWALFKSITMRCLWWCPWTKVHTFYGNFRHNTATEPQLPW